MNWDQFKDPLCYLCLPGTVLAPLSHIRGIVGSNPINLYKKYLINSVDSTEFNKEKL